MMAMAVLHITNLDVVLQVATWIAMWITMMIVMITTPSSHWVTSIFVMQTMMDLVIRKFRYVPAIFKKDM